MPIACLGSYVRQTKTSCLVGGGRPPVAQARASIFKRAALGCPAFVQRSSKRAAFVVGYTRSGPFGNPLRVGGVNRSPSFDVETWNLLRAVFGSERTMPSDVNSVI